MEPNQQYALYDGEAGGAQQWVAHVRLTPELLQRLQRKPSSVAIQLQAPGGGGAARAGSAAKLSSVLTIEEDDDAETYEMLSFREDAQNNAVCAFRARDAGFALFQVGRVYQKLIVQRMLDSTEKDRMKDRHAKSVLESKARASKFVEPSQPRATRGKRLALGSVALSHPPGHALSQVAKRGAPTESHATPAKKRKLRSALSEDQVQELQERIARGRAESLTEGEQDAKDPPAAQQQQPKSSIFSSDSEADKSPERPRGRLEAVQRAESKPSAKQDAPTKKAARKATQKTQEKKITTAVANPPIEPDISAQAKPSPRSTSRTEDAKPAEAIEEKPTATPRSAVATPASPTSKRKAVNQDPVEVATAVAPLVKLPPVKGDKTESKKRARPRLSRLPDISFLPTNVQEICKRVAAHITRTAILDTTDYDSFVAEYGRLRAEWEVLDKAYSVETILVDGAHFQLPFATTEEEQQSLRNTIQEAEKKREGLLFVRDSMATIHKILASLQASISTYEQKTMTTDPA